MTDNADELIKDFKQKVKEYESAGQNPKLFKNFTIRERLAIAEQCLIVLILENKKIKKELFLILNLALSLNLLNLIAIFILCH